MENAENSYVQLEPEADAVHAFEDVLRDCCAVPGEGQFWRQLGDGIEKLQGGVDAGGIARFEYAIDAILVRHGLPAWSIEKGRVETTGE